MSTDLARADRFRALALLSPAYVWLAVAVFLPLSAMAFFSFLTDLPFGGRDWQVTLANIFAPTLLIYGQPGHGGIVTPDLAAEAQRINPNIQSAEIPTAGHNTRRENFADYLAAVRAFLAKD